MSESSGRSARGGAALATFAVLLAGALEAQGPPPATVRFTEAREHAVRAVVALPGTVEARTWSVVASEVEGIVAQLAAREGDRVRRGAPLVRLRKDALELRLQAATAQLREAEARRDLARSNLERSRELFRQEVLSQGQLDDSLSEFDAWQGRVEQLGAEIAVINLDLERSDVAAPFSGIVAAERTRVGEWIGRGDPVAEMISLDDLEVRVEVPENRFGALTEDAPATVTFEAVPGLEVPAHVSALIPRADARSRTFPVKVRLDAKDPRLGAGMLAQVAFAVGEEHPAVVVPKDAVLVRGQRRFVYTVNGDDTVDQVFVETGVAVGGWVEIASGIAAGARVVTRGNERLRPGQKVSGGPEEYALP